MEKKNNINKFSPEEFKKLGYKILRRWYFLVISVIAGVCIAYAINKSAIPVYTVNATLFLKKYEDRKKSPLDVINGDNFFEVERDINKEFVILKSFTNVFTPLSKLDFKVSYYNEGDIKTIELFPHSGILVNIDAESASIPYGVYFVCLPLDTLNYELKCNNKDFTQWCKGRTFRFDQFYDMGGFKFSIKLEDRNLLTGKFGMPGFKVNDLRVLAEDYRGRLGIWPIFKGTTILNVNLISTNPNKDKVFLDAYLEHIVNKGLEDKRNLAVQTLAFLEGQINSIADSLNDFSVQMESIKSRNYNLGTSTGLFDEIRALEKAKVDLHLKIKYLSYLHDYIKDKPLEEPFAPYVVGLDDAALAKLFGELMTMRIETGVIKKEGNQQNPVVKKTEQMINSFEKSIAENIKNQIELNKKNLTDLENKINRRFGDIKGVLKEEREIQSLENMFNVNKELYTLLFEKKLEANIARVSTSSDYEIIDRASCSGVPISPQTQDNYKKGVLGGLMVPVFIIALLHFLNSKVITREDITLRTDIPMLGEIVHNILKKDLIVAEKPKSVIAESFRSIRSNLQFLLGEKGGQGKVILVTSTVSGEGKTFFSINFSYILSFANHKTVLVGADLRKPKVYEKVSISPDIGLSNYLAGIATLDAVIQKSQNSNLDIIPAGELPPNPAELLMSDRLKALITELKNRYEFIIFDTSPVGLVSDALEIVKLVDVSIFLVRQDYSKLEYLENLTDIKKKRNIDNLVLVFNDVNNKKFGYGKYYGYGYSYQAKGYYEENEKPDFISYLKGLFS